MKTLFGLRTDDYYCLPSVRLIHNATISESLLNDTITEILNRHMVSKPIIDIINDATCRVFISTIIYSAASTFNGAVKVLPKYEVSGTHGSGTIDWIIKSKNINICVIVAKDNDISHGIGQSTIQAHAYMQQNIRQCGYDEADLNDKEIFCIVSTGMIMK